MMNENFKNIPAEKFVFAQKGKRIHDTQLETKPIGYFKDAWLRFCKNKSAVVAFALIVFLLVFANCDNVACLDKVGRNVYFLAVNSEVTVSYELSCFGS